MALPENLKEFPDSTTLIELAAKATGLDDFGDPRLRPPLDAMVASFKRDAWPQMTPKARQYAAGTLVEYLGSRMKIVADRKRYPEIAKVEVGEPWIVIGPPRSGSTLLHTLLSMDPDAIAAPLWVCAEPSPPPKLGEASPERLAAANARLTKFLDQIPDMRIMHSYFVEEGANALGEDGHEIMIMANTSKGHWYYYAIDGYIDYLLSGDHSAALDFTMSSCSTCSGVSRVSTGRSRRPTISSGCVTCPRAIRTPGCSGPTATWPNSSARSPASSSPRAASVDLSRKRRVRAWRSRPSSSSAGSFITG